MQSYRLSAHSFYAVKFILNQVTSYKSLECCSNFKFDDGTLKNDIGYKNRAI